MDEKNIYSDAHAEDASAAINVVDVSVGGRRLTTADAIQGAVMDKDLRPWQAIKAYWPAVCNALVQL